MSSLLAIAVVLSLTTQAAGQTSQSSLDRMRRAVALEETGNYAEAAPLLRSLLSSLRGEDLATARYDLGRIDTDPVNAVSELDGAATLSSGRRAAARLAMGELYLLTGDPETARTHLEEARRLKQGAVSERAAFLRGVALLREGKHLESREAFADYLIDYLEGSYQPEARLGIAAANEVLGRPREAIEIYRAVLKQHPNYDDISWPLFRLSELLKEESPSEADAFRSALEKDHPYFVAASVFAPGAVEPSPAVAQPLEVTPPNAIPSTPRPMSQRTPPSPRLDAAPRAPIPLSRPATAQSSGRYRIQAGAFSAQANAQALESTLKNAGYSVEIVPRNSLWIVFVGRYPSQSRAAEALPEIERLVGHKVMIRE